VWSREGWVGVVSFVGGVEEGKGGEVECKLTLTSASSVQCTTMVAVCGIER